MTRLHKTVEEIRAEKKADADRIVELKAERDRKAKEAKEVEANEEAIPAQGNLKDDKDYESENDEDKNENDPKPPKERKRTKSLTGKAERAAKASVTKDKERGRARAKRIRKDQQKEDTSLSDVRSRKSDKYENEHSILYSERDDSLSSVSRSVTPIRKLVEKRNLLDKLKREKESRILRMKIKTERYHELDSGMLASEDEAITDDLQLLDPDLKVLREEILIRFYDKRAQVVRDVHTKTNSVQQKEINKDKLDDTEKSLQVFWTNLKVEVIARNWTSLFEIKHTNEKGETIKIDYLPKPTITT